MDLKIVLWPNPILKKACEVVDPADPENQAILGAMYALMKASRGVGLAANQVGLTKRLLCLDVGSGPEYFINPTIKYVGGGVVELDEGCLSLPGFATKIPRWAEINVHHQLPNGTWTWTSAKGFRAQVLQHEVEHLDGGFFLSRAPPGIRDQGRLAAKLAKKSRR